jgi:hypothetical protein
MRLALLFVAACGGAVVSPSEPAALPSHKTTMLDRTPKERRRMVEPEVYLRAYLGWFGGLVPLDVQNRARPKGLFDAWDDYLSALGLPDYKTDLPRQTQSNTLMLATLGRLGEALCARAAEHDLHGPNGKPTPADQRVVFAFDQAPDSDAAFSERFDILHRTFLGYPAKLAPGERVAKFHMLFTDVAARHAGAKNPLTADETAWVAVCAALVQHPEAELY